MPAPPEFVYVVDVAVYDVYVTVSPGQKVNQASGSNARAIVSTRLSTAGVKAVDELAGEEDRTRSAMLRILIQEAVTARRRKR